MRVSCSRSHHPARESVLQTDCDGKKPRRLERSESRARSTHSRHGWRHLSRGRRFSAEAGDACAGSYPISRRYWFDRTNRRQLAALARAIAEVPKRRVREILWCAFSRLIITKQAGASLALDVAYSRPHKVADETVIRPIEQFEAAVRAVVSAIPFRTPHSTPRARIKVRGR
jgi:hypothetical protein